MDDNFLDDEQVEAAEASKELERRTLERDKDDLRYVLATKNGRRFIWQLMSGCGIYGTSFDGSTNGTIFNEGKRTVGLKILAGVHEALPEAYATMVKESKGGDYV